MILQLSQTDKYDVKTSAFYDLQPWQKINRFPDGTVAINRKDTFAKQCTKIQYFSHPQDKAFQENFGKKHFNFHPESFILPANEHQLIALSNKEPDSKWIAKPVLGGQVRSYVR